MATNQLICSQIISLARIWAQDNDASSNFGVSTTTAQSVLNTLASNWMHQVLKRPQYIPASTSGLTFSAGDTSKVTGGSVNFEEFGDAYQATSTALSFPLAAPLKRVTVDEIIEMYALQPGDTPQRFSGNWTYYAAEKTTDQQDLFRVWVFPALDRTAYLTMKVMLGDNPTAGSDAIDIPYEHGVHLARFLAADMAMLNNRQDLVEGIMSVVPAQYRQLMSGDAYQAMQANQLQSRILEGSD